MPNDKPRRRSGRTPPSRPEGGARPAGRGTARDGKERRERRRVRNRGAPPRQVTPARSSEAAPARPRASGTDEADRLAVVGIGASAGGLEALRLFLKNVPNRSGVAYVVVQHLDPADRGALVELLQRSSDMPIEQVKDGTRVEADHVYVIPPARDM